MSDRVAILREVGYLSALDDEALGDLVSRARTLRFRPGERIVTELESGADLYVVLDGEAEVFVEPRVGERKILGLLRAGGAFGEMSSLTGELRSASVCAVSDAEVLVIADADFDRLRECRPEVAVTLVRLLADRLVTAERALDALLQSSATSPGDAEAAVSRAGLSTKARRGSIGRAWSELVVNRRRDGAFLSLVGFVGTLLAVRLAVYVSFRFDIVPGLIVRAAYLAGFSLIGLSAVTALLTYRPGLRRLIAIAYGVGAALILNELGVTLAFDIFFKDIHTPDPNVPFDLERLYRRTEPLRAIAIGLVVLIQAAYFRPFYRRVAFVLKTRLRKASS
ncbi:MAG: Crp/Fnr family transcriptional regulator [Polyangiales bacterium]